MSQPTPHSRRTAIAIGAASAALTLAALVTAGGMLGVLRSPADTKPAAQTELSAPSIVLVPRASSAAPVPLPPSESQVAPALGEPHDDDDDDDRAGGQEARGERHHGRKHHEDHEHHEHHEREEHDDG